MFSRLFGRPSKPPASRFIAPGTDPFAGQGFIYHEMLTSPDGTIRVLNGYSGGEKGATIIEAKVVEAATGRVLFDLWNTYQQCSIQFSDSARTAEFRVQNAHNGRKREVTINFANETFAFTDNPGVSHPLSKLPELISTF